MRAEGVPPEKITVVENTIDTEEVEATARNLDRSELASARAELGIADDAPIVLYCGGLKATKRIDFLLQACEAAHELAPSMHLVVIGDGPEEHKVKAAAARHPWIHAIGPVFGPSRVRYFAISEALLMPVSVGLVVIDAFATRTPLITTNTPTHGPEAVYLEHEINGLISDASLEAYAGAIGRYLGDPSLRARLRAGCASAARRYTLGNMVERIASGIVRALELRS
jgi:glycosyltransferase involved in cell wall biosynthesis